MLKEKDALIANLHHQLAEARAEKQTAVDHCREQIAVMKEQLQAKSFELESGKDGAAKVVG